MVTNEPLSIVCDELINPNVVICAELLTTPLKSTVPTLPLITLNECDIELKDCVKLLNEFIVVYEPVTNPKSEICIDELIVPATALPLIILLLKDALSVEYDDVDNLPSKELLNAAVTKSVANVVSNEDVN